MARKTNYHYIVTKEKLDKVNHKNIQLLDNWLLFLRTSERSVDTIKNYTSDINIYFVWNMEFNNNIFFGDIFPKDILLFQSWLMETMGMSNNRVRRIKDTLASFCNYLATFENIDGLKEIVRSVPQPKKRTSRKTTVLTDKDVKIILNGFINDCRYMDALACSMAFYGGLKKTDIVKIKTDWFTKDDIESNILYKSPEKIMMKNNTKQANIYVLKKEIDRYLYLWKRERKKLIKKQKFTPSGLTYLFAYRSKKTGHWVKCNTGSTMNTIAERATRILKQNGIDKDFYWESARQYYFDYIERQNFKPEIMKLLKISK